MAAVLPTLVYLEGKNILGALLDTFKVLKAQNTALTATENPAEHYQSDADGWSWQTDLRRRLFQSVRRHWCARTGKDETWFPYSEDFIAKLFLRVRKRNVDEIAGWEIEVGPPPPPPSPPRVARGPRAPVNGQ